MPTYPSVFVSHSHRDNDYCRALVQALRDAGADVWYDANDMTEGELLRRIQPEIYRRPVFVVILSEDALSHSNWVNTESQWGYGRYMLNRQQRRFLPITGKPLFSEDFGEDWVILQGVLRIEGPNRTPLPPQEAAQRVLAVMSQVKGDDAQPGCQSLRNRQAALD